MPYFTDELKTFHVMSDVELENSLNPAVLELIDSFNSGLASGLTWISPWIPGDPNVYTGNKYPKWEKRDQEREKDWRAGWVYGMNKVGRPFPGPYHRW